MFKAVKFGKVRLREEHEELQCAKIFKLNEDFLTAAVFSRILYLPSEVLSALLLRGLDVTPGEVKESAFWPSWTVQSKNAETTRVEPDVHIQFEDLDLIVEAKINDDPCQTPEQWAQEWAAWHQGEYSNREKHVLLLAIGGLGATNAISGALATKIGADANSLLHINFVGVPAIQWVGLSWQELYDRLSSEVVPNSQLARDLTEILRYFGLRRYHFLSDLSGLMRQSMINNISVGSLDVMRRWRAMGHEPNWLETSRASRPISESSIDIFRRYRMTNNEELSNALVDVRKAYRLLYLFQRRILDLVDQLSGKLELKFWYWWPSGIEQSIQGANDPCGRDAWKMLPLFDAKFFYLPRGVKGTDSPQNGQWFLGLLLSPDDGHPEAGRTPRILLILRGPTQRSIYMRSWPQITCRGTGKTSITPPGGHHGQRKMQSSRRTTGEFESFPCRVTWRHSQIPRTWIALPTAFANASRKRQVELPNLHARNTGDDSGWHLELPTSALTDCCPGLLRGMSVSGQLDEKRLLGEVAWLEFRFELHVGLLPGRFRYKLPRNCVGKNRSSLVALRFTKIRNRCAVTQD